MSALKSHPLWVTLFLYVLNPLRQSYSYLVLVGSSSQEDSIGIYLGSVSGDFDIIWAGRMDIRECLKGKTK